MAEAEEEGLTEAVELFNEGRYFEAHEVLERLWLAADGLDRELYQGVLQVAVGLTPRGAGEPQGLRVDAGQGRGAADSCSRPRVWGSTWPACSTMCAPFKAPRRVRGSRRGCACFPKPLAQG